MRRLLFVVALFAAGGCFNPGMPQCSYACGDNGACPEGYVCAADGYCKVEGYTGECPYPDASVPDLAEPADLSMADLSSIEDGGETD